MAKIRDDGFEKRIAYMFGVEDPKPIQEQYLAAIHAMDAAPKNASIENLEEIMTPYFEKCYIYIQQQLNISFSVEEAAIYEFKMFMAHKVDAAAHDIISIMNGLYVSILGGEYNDYQEASEKRTELFKMKARIEREANAELTESQKSYMITLHEDSAQILNERIEILKLSCISVS